MALSILQTTSFGKLGVQSRTQAVARTRELGLLTD